MNFVDLILDPPPKCKQCKERDGVDVRMKAEDAFLHMHMAYVDTWECPECGNEVLRNDRMETPEFE